MTYFSLLLYIQIYITHIKTIWVNLIFFYPLSRKIINPAIDLHSVGNWLNILWEEVVAELYYRNPKINN